VIACIVLSAFFGGTLIVFWAAVYSFIKRLG
jgi:hypothetical protein